MQSDHRHPYARDVAVGALIIGALWYFSGGRQETTTVAAQPITYPADEAEFCSILESAERGFAAAYEERSNTDNGVSKYRLSQKIADIVLDRNRKAFAWMVGHKFGFDNWVFDVNVIEDPSKDKNGSLHSTLYVKYCDSTASLYSDIWGEFGINFLSSLKKGDRIRISGRFLPNNLATDGTISTYDDVDRDWKYTNGGSVWHAKLEPDYRLEAKTLAKYDPSAP